MEGLGKPGETDGNARQAMRLPYKMQSVRDVKNVVGQALRLPDRAVLN